MAFDPAKLAETSIGFDPAKLAATSIEEPSGFDLAPSEPTSRLGHLAAAVNPKDMAYEAWRAGKEAVHGINEAFNPYSETAQARIDAMRAAKGPEVGGVLEDITPAGKGLLSLGALAAAPITGIGRNILGHGWSAVTGAPFEGGEFSGKEVADKAMLGLGARGGVRPVPVPVKPTPPGPFGVIKSEGQETGFLPTIQNEQAAIRNTGVQPEVHARAKEFADQQNTQIAEAKIRLAEDLDPFNQRVVETPQEAGALVQESLRQKATEAKVGVDKAYDTARAQPGEVLAEAFDDFGNRVKSDLTNRPDKVIIDDLTPNASKAISYVEDQVENLRVPNKADPNLHPYDPLTGKPAKIVGINLEGVDQMRRHLSALKRRAYESGNASDGRATKAVIDAFDDHVNAAVNNGLFTGNKYAVQAWNDARAAHADYRSTFSKRGGRDPVGNIIEKIIGRGHEPTLTPNAVADHLYGASGVNPKSINSAVAERVKKIFGTDSPEWSAVRQGLWERLTESGEGIKDFGAGTAATRISKFLNADDAARSVFAPHERDLLRKYSDLMRDLAVPQAGANWSNTATFASRAAQKIGGTIGKIVGAAVGLALGYKFHIPGVGEPIGMAVGAGAAKAIGAIGRRSQVKKDLELISKQLPLLSEQVKQWQTAVAKAAKINTPPNQAAVKVAAANVMRSLDAIRMPQIPTLQGMGVSGADENKPNVPRPPTEKKHGGRVNDKPRMFIKHLPLARRTIRA